LIVLTQYALTQYYMHNSETKQLQVVEKFSKSNFEHNKELSDLIVLAVEICNVHIVLITLMHENTQVIKCKIGVDVNEISRKDTFCRYLRSDEVMVVPDALEDKRFVNNPVVKGELAIRFYAGAPLVTSTGVHIGSLCIADQKPQSLTENQKEMLAIIARQVMYVMELQVSLNLIKQKHLALKSQRAKTAESERKLRAFFNSATACHVLLDKKYTILDFNKCADFFIKKYRGKSLKTGNSILLYVNDDYVKKFIGYFELAVNGITTIREVELKGTANKPSWWDITFQPIFNRSNAVSGVSFTAANVDERKKHMAKIVSQKSSLLDIAYIQSHEYRRPVASIMGLMNVIKQENYKPNKECLVMMGVAVEELDLKLREVINHTHDHPVNALK
jgi:hypothetical protein